jgi:DNA-binding GntR family transcriptional regulator
MRKHAEAMQPTDPLIAPSTPIARRSLHDEVVTRLRDAIVEGRLQAGERIPELELCQQFGVSRTPLREALKVLASEGLVELTQHRGAAVKLLTAKDVQDMLDLMGVLEEFAGQLACGAGAEDLDAIEALHARMMECYQRRERRGYFQLNQEIHDAIVRAGGSAPLISVHAGLKARMRRVRYLGSDGAAEWREAVAEHEGIMAALRTRDGATLGQRLRQHLANTWRRVAPFLGPVASDAPAVRQ